MALCCPINKLAEPAKRVKSADSKATEEQFTIGPIDDICRLLLLLSDVHKQNMLRNPALAAPVYPERWTWLGPLRDAKGDPIGRIPAARRDAQDFVIAPGLICESLNEIRNQRDLLLDALKESAWTMVDCVPMTLDRAFPRHSQAVSKMLMKMLTWNNTI